MSIEYVFYVLAIIYIIISLILIVAAITFIIRLRNRIKKIRNEVRIAEETFKRLVSWRLFRRFLRTFS